MTTQLPAVEHRPMPPAPPSAAYARLTGGMPRLPRQMAWLVALSLWAAASVALAAERAIEKQVVVPAPLSQTWEAWTTREGIRSFFAPEAVIEPRVGGLFEIQFDPGAAPGLRGADGMRFMALQPMQMLSFEWNAPPSLPEARLQRTFVVLRFEAVDASQTRVSLTHTGWGSGGQWDAAYNYFDRAWGNVLGNLKKRFETGPVDWAPWLKQLDAARQRPASQQP